MAWWTANTAPKAAANVEYVAKVTYCATSVMLNASIGQVVLRKLEPHREQIVHGRAPKQLLVQYRNP